MIIKLDDFILKEFDINDKNDLIFLDKLIKSNNSELFCRDIKKYILTNIERRREDGITNSYICIKDNEDIGLASVNYHPKEDKFDEEIEIGLILLDNTRGKGYGTIIERELSEKLLEMYPRFNMIVGRIDKDNLPSLKAVQKAGFEYVSSNEKYNSDEYVFRR